MKAYSFKLKEQNIFHGKVYCSFDELIIAINHYTHYYNNIRIKKIELAEPCSISKSSSVYSLVINF